jgi:uncharacterized protein YdeI (YjbR/CyaY-like superfamily)
MSVFKISIYHKLKLSYIVVTYFWIPTPKKEGGRERRVEQRRNKLREGNKGE